MAQFKIGDVVRLKSGGPSMTISDRSSDMFGERSTTDWWCVWFDDKNVRQEATFHQDTLEPDDEE